MRKHQNHIFQLYSYFKKNENKFLSGQQILSINPICLHILKNCNSYGSNEEKYIIQFLSKIKTLKIESSDKGRVETRGNYELTHFTSLSEIQLINCKPSIIVNLNEYRKQFTIITVFGCLNSLEELLDFQALPNPEVWSILQLNLSRNNIPAIDKSAELLEKVEQIDLSHNLIFAIDNFEKCKSLKLLNLSFNRVEDLSALHYHLKNIRILNLKNNYITSLTGLGKLFLLENLDLSNNFISSFKEVEKLSNLRNLNWIWLEGNPLADLDNYRPVILRCFAREIILDGKNLTDAERSFVADLQTHYVKSHQEDDVIHDTSPTFTKRKKRLVEFGNDDQQLSALEVAEILPDMPSFSDIRKYQDELQELRNKEKTNWLLALHEKENMTSFNSPSFIRKKKRKFKRAVRPDSTLKIQSDTTAVDSKLRIGSRLGSSNSIPILVTDTSQPNSAPIIVNSSENNNPAYLSVGGSSYNNNNTSSYNNSYNNSNSFSNNNSYNNSNYYNNGGNNNEDGRLSPASLNYNNSFEENNRMMNGDHMQMNGDHDSRIVNGKMLEENEFLVEKEQFGEVCQRVVQVGNNCIKEFDVNSILTLQIDDKELVDISTPATYQVSGKNHVVKLSYKIANENKFTSYTFRSDLAEEKFLKLSKQLLQSKKLFCMSCKTIYFGDIDKSKCPKCQSSYHIDFNKSATNTELTSTSSSSSSSFTTSISPSIPFSSSLSPSNYPVNNNQNISNNNNYHDSNNSINNSNNNNLSIGKSINEKSSFRSPTSPTSYDSYNSSSYYNTYYNNNNSNSSNSNNNNNNVNINDRTNTNTTDEDVNTPLLYTKFSYNSNNNNNNNNNNNTTITHTTKLTSHSNSDITSDIKPTTTTTVNSNPYIPQSTDKHDSDRTSTVMPPAIQLNAEEYKQHIINEKTTTSVDDSIVSDHRNIQVTQNARWSAIPKLQSSSSTLNNNSNDDNNTSPQLPPLSSFLLPSMRSRSATEIDPSSSSSSHSSPSSSITEDRHHDDSTFTSKPLPTTNHDDRHSSHINPPIHDPKNDDRSIQSHQSNAGASTKTNRPPPSASIAPVSEALMKISEIGEFDAAELDVASSNINPSLLLYFNIHFITSGDSETFLSYFRCSFLPSALPPIIPKERNVKLLLTSHAIYILSNGLTGKAQLSVEVIINLRDITQIQVSYALQFFKITTSKAAYVFLPRDHKKTHHFLTLIEIQDRIQRNPNIQHLFIRNSRFFSSCLTHCIFNDPHIKVAQHIRFYCLTHWVGDNNPSTSSLFFNFNGCYNPKTLKVTNMNNIKSVSVIITSNSFYLCSENYHQQHPENYFTIIEERGISDISSIDIDNNNPHFVGVNFSFEDDDEEDSSEAWKFYFHGNCEKSEFVHRLSDVWHEIFSVDIQLNHLN